MNKRSPLPPARSTGPSDTASRPGKPKSSGYAEPRPKPGAPQDKPNPEAAGNQASQVAPLGTVGNVESPSDAEESKQTEPGENIEYPSGSAPLDGL
jgi:hypothetical protein